ncbi:MAG: hypothetical protein QME12_05730 [Nanoarchaeota archaeon]|nr:hypothetical protein [Nanoarchaeota archaeon]
MANAGQKRQTAFIFWIKDIISAASFIDPVGFKSFNVIDKNVRRVNVIAAVVDIYENADKKYKAVTLDDGSGQVRAKAWEEDVSVLDASVGDIVLLVGLLHESAGEIFIRPEIMKKMSAEWAFARRQYLNSVYGEKKAEALEVKEETIGEALEPTMEARGKVVSLISSDEGMVNVEELIAKSGMPSKLVEKILDELIKDGEIFRPKAGFVQAI